MRKKFYKSKYLWAFFIKFPGPICFSWKSKPALVAVIPLLQAKWMENENQTVYIFFPLTARIITLHTK